MNKEEIVQTLEKLGFEKDTVVEATVFVNKDGEDLVVLLESNQAPWCTLITDTFLKEDSLDDDRRVLNYLRFYDVDNPVI